jgi:hypothetical protein
MKRVTTTPELSPSTTEINSHLFDDWFDPIESGIRDRVRGLIEEMLRGELDAALTRPRYARRAGHAADSGVAAVVSGHRHGSRVRTLMGTFGKAEIAVPRAQLNTSDGKTAEWKSQALVRPDSFAAKLVIYQGDDIARIFCLSPFTHCQSSKPNIDIPVFGHAYWRSQRRPGHERALP